MFTTYARLKTTAQKKDAPSASSVFDASSQNKSLQRKADMANGTAQRVETPRPNNTGMPDNLKAGIESLSGFSMDDVRVHYNSSKPATVQALAYTQGTDIHVAPGQEKHLPHEAWHVAQQMAGRVSPTTNINGMPVNDNAALEHEADVMGEKAAQCKQEGYGGNNSSQMKSKSMIVQKTAGDLVCDATIFYEYESKDNHGKKTKKMEQVHDSGMNNAGDRNAILGDFTQKKFDALGAVGQVAGGNPAGQCAEPHAVRNAIMKLPTGIFMKIKGITVTNAKATQQLLENQKVTSYHRGKLSKSQKRKTFKEETQGLNGVAFKKIRKEGDGVYERCLTCQQWIPQNDVLPNFIPTDKIKYE